MAETQRGLLAGEARRAGRRQVAPQSLQLARLAALGESPLQLEVDVEMVFDHSLAAAGDEDEVLDAGRSRLVDDMLDDGPVHDRQHFLRDGLRGGKKSGAQSGDGKTAFRMRALLRHMGSDGGNVGRA